MFCEKCGTQNPDDAKFCSVCGAKFETAAKTEEPASDNNDTNAPAEISSDSIDTKAPVETAPAETAPAKKKGSPVKILIAALAAVLLIAGGIVAFIIIDRNNSTIDFDKYISVDVTGYEGYGTAKATIDWDSIEDKYGNKVKLAKDAKKLFKALGANYDEDDVFESFTAFVNVKLTPSTKLKNGDKVKFELDMPEELGKMYKFRYKSKGGEIEVSDLKAVESFDPFEGLVVEFSGISGEAYFEYNYNGSLLNVNDFSYDKNYGLKNGDTVEFKIDEATPDYYLNRIGKVPSSFSKTYTVEGLDEYVSKYSDIPSETLTKLKKEAEDSVKSYATQYGSTITASDITYCGYVFRSIKDDVSIYWGDTNTLYLIFSAYVSSNDAEFMSKKVYYPIAFGNFLKTGNDLTYSKDSSISGYFTFDTTYKSSNGYYNPYLCYSEIYSENLSNYDVEAGDGFEKFDKVAIISKPEDISDEFKNVLYEDAKNTVEANMIYRYDGLYDYSDLGVFGEYLLISKNPGDEASENNKFIVVVAANVKNAGTNKTAYNATVYFPVVYEGIIKLPDGNYFTAVKRSSRTFIGGNEGPVVWFNNTTGYVEGKNLYKEEVKKFIDKYTIYCSDELKVFDEDAEADAKNDAQGENQSEAQGDNKSENNNNN